MGKTRDLFKKIRDRKGTFHAKMGLIKDRNGMDSWIRKIPWRRKWLPTLVFLPGEFHGQRSLVGYSHFFLLYNIVLVLPYINMNPPQVYTCSPS